MMTNLNMKEQKKLCIIAAKIYLMRWRIEEYFKFKKQQFELEDFRVMSLQFIRNLNLLATPVTGYIGIMNSEKDNTIFMMELMECSKRIYEVPEFIFYALGYAIAVRLRYQKLPVEKATITTAYTGSVLWNRGFQMISL